MEVKHMDSIGYQRISWSFEPTVSAPGRVRMLLRSHHAAAAQAS